MNHSFKYVGCFFEKDMLARVINQLGKERLEITKEYPHVTFSYRPQEVDETLFGEKIEVRMIGYGNNGTNEGVKVEVQSNNKKLQEMIDCIEVPHITLSTSLTGSPVDTKSLVFEPISQVEFTGVYGGYTEWDEVVI